MTRIHCTAKRETNHAAINAPAAEKIARGISPQAVESRRPVPHLLLPGDQVPDERAVGYEAEENDDDDGGEGGGTEDSEGQDWVSSEAILPDAEC